MFPTRRGDAVEVLEHVEQRRNLILVAAAALELAVVASEQLLGQLEHPREVRLGDAQQRHDHVERVIDRDLLNEIAFRAHRQHLVDVVAGQLVDANLQRPHRLWTKPVRADRPDHAMLRIVQMDQRAHTGGGLKLVTLRRRQDRARPVGEQHVVAFDVHDVGVLGNRPERAVLRHLDPRNRRVGAQMSKRRMQLRLVGVGQRIAKDLGGFVHSGCTHGQLLTGATLVVRR